MNNLQKLGRLFAFFASCDWGHNNNTFKLEGLDNGWLLEIELMDYDDSKLDVDFKFTHGKTTDDFFIAWKDRFTVHAYTSDYEKLDELLEIIFSKVILTDIATLSVKEEENSN